MKSQFNFSGQDISTNIQNIAAAASVIMDADVASVKAQPVGQRREDPGIGRRVDPGGAVAAGTA